MVVTYLDQGAVMQDAHNASLIDLFEGVIFA